MKAREAVIWGAVGLLMGAGAQKLMTHFRASDFKGKENYELISKIQKITKSIPKSNDLKEIADQKKTEKAKPKPIKIKQVAAKPEAPKKEEAPKLIKEQPKALAAKKEADEELETLERMGNVADMLDGKRQSLASSKTEKKESVTVAQERNVLERQINIVNDLFSD
jgi:hypothetical protein